MSGRVARAPRDAGPVARPIDGSGQRAPLGPGGCARSSQSEARRWARLRRSRKDGARRRRGEGPSVVGPRPPPRHARTASSGGTQAVTEEERSRASWGRAAGARGRSGDARRGGCFSGSGQRTSGTAPRALLGRPGSTPRRSGGGRPRAWGESASAASRPSGRDQNEARGSWRRSWRPPRGPAYVLIEAHILEIRPGHGRGFGNLSVGAPI